jgi:hypothetical protein
MYSRRIRFISTWATVIALGVAVFAAGPARAHEDPPGCFETGPAIIVSVFRANGTTGVVGTVSECENINYRATLQKAADSDTICAFSGGTFRLTTPDGVAHDIDLNVPCIGGTSGEGCDSTVDFVQSALIPYTVDPADVVAGSIVATAVYTGGVVHDSPDNTGGVGANTPKSTPVSFCTENDLCTIDVCDPNVAGSAACIHTPIVCDDNDICSDDACDPATGNCVFTRDDTNDPSCNPPPPIGCRITAGGIAPDGGVDLEDFASIVNAYHGGQVGAPCGCIGCFDEFDHVQGQWQHQRKRQKGNFHASDYNSLVCGCDGVLDGNLCGDRDTGPLPRPAPANLACFSGTGTLRRGGRVQEAAFRVEVEDRGEPGAGDNSAPTPDVYRIRIWVPRGQETVDGLAAGACCTNGAPLGDASRAPEIDDGGEVSKGNIQIHPQVPAHVGECPVPSGVCEE